jgi:coenzyme F420-reducing hydrogenase delta subunit
MEKTFTLQELFFIFEEGCRQGDDEHSALESGSYTRNSRKEAFKDAIRDVLMDRKTPREWVDDAEVEAFTNSLKG